MRTHLISLGWAGGARTTLFSIRLRQETSAKIFRLGQALLLARYCLVRVRWNRVLRISHDNKAISGINIRIYRLLLESLRVGKCALINKIFDHLLRMVIYRKLSTMRYFRTLANLKMFPCCHLQMRLRKRLHYNISHWIHEVLLDCLILCRPDQESRA